MGSDTDTGVTRGEPCRATRVRHGHRGGQGDDRAANVAVAEASTFDIVSPSDHPTLRGAITVLMNTPDADPKAGEGDNILLR